MCSRRAVAGRTVRRSTVRRRRSTTGFAAGRFEGCGDGSLKRLRSPNPVRIRPSTARPPKRIARQRAERGAEAQAIGRSRGGQRDENPRHRRRPRTPHRVRSDARPTRRRPRRRGSDQRRPVRFASRRRRRLRQRPASAVILLSEARCPSSPTIQRARARILSTRTPNPANLRFQRATVSSQHARVRENSSNLTPRRPVTPLLRVKAQRSYSVAELRDLFAHADLSPPPQSQGASL